MPAEVRGCFVKQQEHNKCQRRGEEFKGLENTLISCVMFTVFRFVGFYLSGLWFYPASCIRLITSKCIDPDCFLLYPFSLDVLA